MEMPIQVIVVLFIALVVGGAIIAFSRSTLDNAQLQLNEQWRKDPANKEHIVSVANATDETILSLSQECIERNVGTVDERLCFGLFADTMSANFAGLNGRSIGTFKLNTSAVAAGARAVRITYHPAGRIIVS